MVGRPYAQAEQLLFDDCIAAQDAHGVMRALPLALAISGTLWMMALACLDLGLQFH